MAFTKRDIKDRVVEHPHRYQLNPVSGQADVYDLSPITGTVIEGGTAINKIYLQPIEDTLEDITTPKYGVATGTNSYVVTVPNISTLVIGLQLMVKFTNASTGATSINVNGLGSKLLIKAGGGSPKIKANGIYTIGYDGTSFQLLGEGGEYGNALASDVLSPKTIGTDNGIVTGTIPSRGASTITPSTSTQTIASGQYLSGTQTISAVAGLSAGNIKNATVVGGVTGTYKGTGTVAVGNVLSGQTFSTATLASATGTMPNRGAVTSTLTTQGGAYTIPSGYHTGAGKVTASFANLVAGNIKSGVNIGGVVGNIIEREYYTGSLYLAASRETIIPVPSNINILFVRIASGNSTGWWTSPSVSNESGYIRLSKSEGNFIALPLAGRAGTATFEAWV